MNQPLGNYVGNWLEVKESIKVLRGEVSGDLLKLSLSLAGAMIYLGGKSKSINSGIKIAEEKISNGDAFNKFVEVVDLQGGNTKFILNPEKYRKSRFAKRIRASRSGFIKAIDNYEIGMASLELGAGRKSLKDKIDPKAGIIFKIKIGDKVKKSEIIAELHSDSKTKIDIASKMILSSISYSNKKVAAPRLIKKVIA
jgi:thymidine phosphorylase